METNVKRQKILILGVQGLSYNDFTLAEIKIGLKIVEHAQQIITGYSIPMNLTHESYWLPPEQVAAKHADVTMKLNELGFGSKHIDWLRSTLHRMEQKLIRIPYKVGNITQHAHFDQLFKASAYKNRHGVWMVTFSFDNNLLRYFYSFEKGAGRIDLNAVSQCRSASSLKLYILMNCLAMKGYTHIKPQHLMGIMHGDEHYYKTWSALERKTLAFAFQDLKRLYDHHIIDQYLTYKPFFNEEEGCDLQHHHMPAHITLTIHDRANSGDVPDGEVSQELRGRRSQLKLLLTYQYDVDEKVATSLSKRLSLDMIGELSDWFVHKDYYLERCKQEHRRMNRAAYISKSLDGFFRDRNA